MCFVLQTSFSVFSLVILLSLFINPSYCLHLKSINVSHIIRTRNVESWSPAGATWYGSPIGDGSEGGACGYGDAVGKPPFSSMVSAGGASLFNAGKGCGACYEVKCTEHSACSGNPVTAVITDECPGGPCASEAVHFDLSGTVFGALAKPGQADNLRKAGVLQIQHRRVRCNYIGTSIAFKIDAGTNPYYMAFTIEYGNGDGTLAQVQLQQNDGSNSWLPMQRSWGAIWKLNYGSALKAPFSVKLVSDPSHETLEANNVIPDGRQPGQTYRSLVNFSPN